MGLVEIVNPNGQKGLVADTSDAARLYERPPSSRNNDAVKHEDVPGDPAHDFTPTHDPEPTARNASTEEWRTYATTVRGAQPDEVADLSRDELIELYGEPADPAHPDNGQEA